jgi:serine/threonine protein kinase
LHKDRSAHEFASQRRAMAVLGLGRVVRGPAVKETHGAPIGRGISPLSGLAPVAAARHETTVNIVSSTIAGAVIAGFAIEKLIGYGSYGAVYQATRTITGQRTALKLCQGAVVDDIQAELHIYKMLASHYLFSRCFGGGSIPGAGGMSWLALEMADGSLRKRLKAAKASEEDRHAIAMQVGTGLGFLHERQVCHLDVKSENITWCDEQRKACLCDFGMSEVSNPRAQRYELYCTSFNRPPELWDEPNPPSEINTSVDIWSFGLVLWETASLDAARFHWNSFPGKDIFGSIMHYCRAFRKPSATSEKDIEAARDDVTFRLSLATRPWRQVLLALCIPDPTCRPTLTQNDERMLTSLRLWQEQPFPWSTEGRRSSIEHSA